MTHRVTVRRGQHRPGASEPRHPPYDARRADGFNWAYDGLLPLPLWQELGAA